MKKKLAWSTDIIKFILRDLMKDGWRTVVTILNLMTFMICYFCLAAVSQAAKQYGQQGDDQNTLMVISKNVFDPGDSLITAEEFAPIRALIPQMVESVSPLIFRLIRIDNYLIQIRGTPLEDMQQIYSLTLKEGSWPQSNTEVAIGEGTALLTKWPIGKVIRAYGKDFTIVGILSSPGTKSSAVWMTLNAAEALFGTSGVYQFAWIKAAKGADVEAVKETLRADPELNRKFDVYYVDQMYAQYSDALEDINVLYQLLVVLALLLVMFGTYGSTFLTLSERNREVTVLRAIGFSAAAIRSILVIRTYVQILLAYLASWGLSEIILDWMQATKPLMVHAIRLDVVINPKIWLFGFILSFFFGGLGILIPTLSLKRTSVFQEINN